MMSNELETKNISPGHVIEDQSRDIFAQKLPYSERIFHWYDRTHPNCDGFIEFFDENGSTTVKLFFSLKSTMSENDCFHDCEIAFLRYCYRCNEPTFLVFVNIPTKMVYYEHIDKYFINQILGIKDLGTINQKTKRIIFSNSRMIDNNAQELIGICVKHYENVPSDSTSPGQTIDKELETERKVRADNITKGSAIGQKRKLTQFSSIRKTISDKIDSLVDKIALYHSIIYMMRPIYLDHRGDRKRRQIIKYLTLTDSEERFIIEYLSNNGFIERAGALISVCKISDALSILNYFIDEGRIDPEILAESLSDYET